MAVTAHIDGDRGIKYNSKGNATISYIYLDCVNQEDDVLDNISLIPTTYKTMKFASYEISPIGEDTFRVDAEYAITTNDPTTQGAAWSFNSGSGQVLLTTSPDTIVYASTSNTASQAIPAETKYFINYDPESGAINGCTIPDTGDGASYNVSYTQDTKPNTAIYYNNKYKVNSVAWGDYPAKTVLYLGTDCNYDPTTELYSINHNFAVGKNQSSITITGFTCASTIAKDAWDVFDFVFDDDVTSSNLKIKKLTNIKRHKVYANREFDIGATLGIDPEGNPIA